jgi:hypothetical protein
MIWRYELFIFMKDGVWYWYGYIWGSSIYIYIYIYICIASTKVGSVHR